MDAQPFMVEITEEQARRERKKALVRAAAGHARMK
jgi:hypothetical protein